MPDYDGVRVFGVDSHCTYLTICAFGQPITDITSNDVICNGGINPYQTPLPSAVITAAAGATVTAEMHHTLAGADPSDSADPVDPSHKGELYRLTSGALPCLTFIEICRAYDGLHVSLA